MKNKKVRDIKSIYRRTKQQLGWSSTGPPTALEIEGNFLTKPKEIADRMIDHFKEKIEKLKRNLTVNNDNPLKILQRLGGI